MNLAQLQQLLDVHGTDASAWPADVRRKAEDFINSDATAAQAYGRTRRLDELMGRVAASDLPHDAALQPSADRVLRALPAQLPPQKRAWRWWPAELARFDFEPAWTRVAALASVAVVGFALGFAGLDSVIAGGVTRATQADTDLSAIVFDPEPATGLRP